MDVWQTSLALPIALLVKGKRWMAESAENKTDRMLSRVVRN